MAPHVGHSRVPTVAGPVAVAWSVDALADLDRFAAEPTLQYRYDGGSVLMLRVFHGRERR